MDSYQAECVALESPHWNEPNRRLLHVAMGLVTESTELLNFEGEKNFLEELGDVMWYVAVGCDVLGVTITEAVEQAHDPDDDAPLVRIAVLAGDTIDFLKKQIFYGKPYDPQKVVKNLGEITLMVCTLAEDVDSNLEEIEVLNLAKLHRRYKGGVFGPEAAINRDVKHEMEVYS